MDVTESSELDVLFVSLLSFFPKKKYTCTYTLAIRKNIYKLFLFTPKIGNVNRVRLNSYE